MQSQPNSCGAAALAHLLRKRGVADASEKQLMTYVEQRYAATEGRPPAAGYSLADIVGMAEEEGFSAIAQRVDPVTLKTLQPPFLLLKKSVGGGHHFLVVERLAKRDMTVFDPAVGRSMVVPLELIGQRWLAPGGTGIIVTVTQTNS